MALDARARQTPGRAFDERIEVFATELDSLRKAHRLPGMAAAIVRDGDLAWSRGYGLAYVDDEVSVTPDTPFRVASITKTFVGLVFLQLAEDGVVRLDPRRSGSGTLALRRSFSRPLRVCKEGRIRAVGTGGGFSMRRSRKVDPTRVVWRRATRRGESG